jgi:hypothetical protein
MESETFQKRRPGCKLPITNGVDLNNIPQNQVTLSSLLETIDQGDTKNSSKNGTFTIYLWEGIFLHLERGSAAKVLGLLRSFAKSKTMKMGRGTASCFATASQ